MNISCQLKQASRISESNGEFRYSRKHILHVNWVERRRKVLGLNLGKYANFPKQYSLLKLKQSKKNFLNVLLGI